MLALADRRGRGTKIGKILLNDPYILARVANLSCQLVRAIPMSGFPIFSGSISRSGNFENSRFSGIQNRLLLLAQILLILVTVKRILDY